MNILNVNPSIDLKAGGGGAERTFQMSRFLARCDDVKCTVLTLDTGLGQGRALALAPAEVVALPNLLQRFHVPRISRKNWKIIRRLVGESDIIHLMAHWSVLNALVYLVARLAHKPYVVCPVGSLSLFGRSGWLKRAYNFIVGKAIVRHAAAWIAVTSGEFKQFEDYGVPSSQVTVIPNGVCAEDFPLADRSSFLRHHNLPDAPIILFVGRLNLIKGPDLLLKAFSLVRDRFPDHHCVFAGPDFGMLSELQNKVREESLNGRVHFLGYVSGAEKSAAYRCAELLVVPSRQEAMSIVALEAGICGTPALLTDQCGFSEVRLIDPRLEVPATAEGIAQGLINLLGDQRALREIAPVWQNFVVRNYSWESMAPQYMILYQRILERAFQTGLAGIGQRVM
jgi:glycosyltransferase involved in cell wall biosynthesis